MTTIWYPKLYDFENLYKAHLQARKSKRYKTEVVNFELNLGSNLTNLCQKIKHETYTISGYYKFDVYEPKKRIIHALHYVDRVVQHCLCDEIIAPVIDKKLIYDCAACRINKGTTFVYKRLTGFLTEFYKHHGTDGYFLRCDIKKFFDSIDHSILKGKINKIFGEDNKLIKFIYNIIDSYETTKDKGLPMGNQTSQWFANYYLDFIDRFIKEICGIKYYTRYMDDFLLISHDKFQLKLIKEKLELLLKEHLQLSFNQKTQIYPIKNGVDFLGFHFYLTKSGKVIRKIMKKTKNNFKRKMKLYVKLYAENKIEAEDVWNSLASYIGHLRQGHTYRIVNKIRGKTILSRKTIN